MVSIDLTTAIMTRDSCLIEKILEVMKMRYTKGITSADALEKIDTLLVDHCEEDRKKFKSN